MHRNPDFFTVVVGGFASLFGGLARWYSANLFGAKFNPTNFAFDMVMSAIAGVGIYWLVWELGQPDSVCAMAAAVTGNIGSRVFDIFQVLLRKRGIELDDVERK